MDKGAFQQTWDVCQKAKLFITIFSFVPFPIHTPTSFSHPVWLLQKAFPMNFQLFQNCQKFLNSQANVFKKKFLSVVKQSEMSIEAFVC